MDADQSLPCEFAFLELQDIDSAHSIGFHEHNGKLRDISVHTISRYKSSRGLHILLGAEIQETQLLGTAFEKPLKDQDALPGRVEADSEEVQFHRGFMLAYSGGMVSSFPALDGRGLKAMFRGIALPEQELPTLARKHLSDRLDGRMAVPKAARSHANLYENERSQLKSQAGVMGDFYVLACGLSAQYDFRFWYSGEVSPTGTPSTAVAAHLDSEGWGHREKVDGTDLLHVLGFGAFKADGGTIFGDVGPKKRIKQLEALDLLVCWDFEDSVLDDHKWASKEILLDKEKTFPGQTHSWEAQSGTKYPSRRTIPVVALGDLLTRLYGKSLQTPPDEWPEIKNYYQG